MKSEPDVYSIAQLQRDRRTNWDHIRNYQARNYLRTCQVGDWVWIYHSGDERSIVGVAEVAKKAYPDLDEENPGDWVQVDLAFVQKLATPVTLKQLKADPTLASLLLIKQSRLSVSPVTRDQQISLLKLAGVQS